jgi:hypothetical protein
MVECTVILFIIVIIVIISVCLLYKKKRIITGGNSIELLSNITNRFRRYLKPPDKIDIDSISKQMKTVLDSKISVPQVGITEYKDVVSIPVSNKKHYDNLKYHIWECGGDISKMKFGKTITIGFPPKSDKESNLYKMSHNKNTIEFLQYQNLKRYKKLKNRSEIYSKFINWHYILPPLVRDNILVVSGFVPLVLGIRVINDVDLHIGSKVLNMDISYPKYIDTDCGKVDALKKLSRYYQHKVDIQDPKHYMYWLGIKCYTIKSYMWSRFLRQRPKSIADLIMIKKHTPLSPKIPPIPKFKVWYNGAYGERYQVDNYFKYKMYMGKTDRAKLWKDRIPVDRDEYQGKIDFYVRKMENLV